MSIPRQILDPFLRRRARMAETPVDRFQVRVATTLEDFHAASLLVHSAYVYQGIESVRSSELRLDDWRRRAHSHVLVAYEGEQLVGTMTVVMDSDAGLPLDKDYPGALNAMRQQGARIVEYSAYAIVERCWHAGVSNLLCIAANALMIKTLFASHAVVGVHPRVAPYYRAVFNFHELARPKQHATLRAPVIGLMQEMDGLREFARRHYRKPMASGRLPGDHFFGEPLACIDLRGPVARPVPLRVVRAAAGGGSR